MQHHFILSFRNENDTFLNPVLNLFNTAISGFLFDLDFKDKIPTRWFNITDGRNKIVVYTRKQKNPHRNNT